MKQKLKLELIKAVIETGKAQSHYDQRALPDPKVIIEFVKPLVEFIDGDKEPGMQVEDFRFDEINEMLAKNRVTSADNHQG